MVVDLFAFYCVIIIDVKDYMEALNSIPSTHNPIPEQTSFSFDHPQPHDLPKRTINNCLRLKTNESLDGRASIELTR